MMTTRRLGLLAFTCVSAVLASACGTTNRGEVSRTDLQGETVALGTAAETRLIMTTPNNRMLDPDPNNHPPSSVLTCAEPSPDIAMIAASAFAASGNAGSGLFGNDSNSQVSGSMGGMRAEQAAELGRRLATVQLARDALFRACEAYANGAIDEAMYAVMLSRFDDLMVALFAVEMAQGGDPNEAQIGMGGGAFASLASSGAGGANRAAAAEGEEAEAAGGEDAEAGSMMRMVAEAFANAGAQSGPRVVVQNLPRGGPQAVAEIADGYFNDTNGDALMVACIAALTREENQREHMYSAQSTQNMRADSFLGACLHPDSGILVTLARFYSGYAMARLDIERLEAQAEAARALSGLSPEALALLARPTAQSGEN